PMPAVRPLMTACSPVTSSMACACDAGAPPTPPGVLGIAGVSDKSPELPRVATAARSVMSLAAWVRDRGGNVGGLCTTSSRAPAPPLPPPSSIGSPSASKNAPCSKLWPGLGASCATTRTCLVDCTSVAFLDFLDDREAVGEHVPAVD